MSPPQPKQCLCWSLWLLLERLLRCLLLGLAQALLCTYFHSAVLLALLKAPLFPLFYSSFCRLVLSRPLSLTLLSILAWSKKKFSTNLNHFGLASPICMFENSIHYLKLCCLFIPASITWQRHFCLLKFSLLSVSFQNICSIKRGYQAVVIPVTPARKDTAASVATCCFHAVSIEWDVQWREIFSASSHCV